MKDVSILEGRNLTLICLYLEITYGLERYVGRLVDKGRTVMVFLMCQLGEASFPSYSIRHYSRCCCERSL